MKSSCDVVKYPERVTKLSMYFHISSSNIIEVESSYSEGEDKDMLEASSTDFDS